MHELNCVPQETITSVSYNKDILISLWSGELMLYSGVTFGCKGSVEAEIPVTRAILTSDVVAGDIEGSVRIYDMSLNEKAKISSGVGGIQLLHEYKGSVVAGGWNKKIVFVNGCVENVINTEKKVYCSDILNDVLLVGQQEYVVAYDLRTNSFFFRRQFNTVVRSLALGPGGFFAGTTDGRIYYEDFEDKSRSYVFNAHYSISGDSKIFYPVNSIVVGKYLLSGGSDGRVLRWKLEAKKTYKEIACDKVGVSGLCTAEEKVAIGFSYSHDRGEKEEMSCSRVVLVDL
ncbi:WD40 domain-containing putative poly(A)+ RNA export protein [Encephalitozoon intestinalis ATCC 50506]|uniref:WD40 domain-containing putative poly(A)+ RNA export protein n=1 Tax=Encephalitozoon intestinalis (strain ATCC 50506) TaxID=876142 RepID=E0S8K4_ENCIT|nr:WD40 domain-containing putative poly(A)+ RNA export protein [Encephalitozoon intestinalis ATCC 50506]ADM11998.1 WD40 domain-containing putative poly(A)+ RNA export protein [Encephalitozoon intestinalis ATCC 50506]